jgi:serine/threonine protein kinase
VDHRTDLFSLGAVLYEMATGQQAFTGSSIAVIFEAILNRMPTAAARVNPELPDALDRAIWKALEKDPWLRCQSAAELCADLRRIRRDIDAARAVVSGSAQSAPTVHARLDPRAEPTSTPNRPATERTPPRMADERGVGGEVRAGVRIKPSQATRQRTIDVLCQHFATETLDNDEFEHRVDLAHRVDTVHFCRADFGGGAYLHGANLCGADLSGVLDLEQWRLDSALGDRSTTLPDSLHHPEPWPQESTETPS